jgi:hypothetical protein
MDRASFGAALGKFQGGVGSASSLMKMRRFQTVRTQVVLGFRRAGQDRWINRTPMTI